MAAGRHFAKTLKTHLLRKRLPDRPKILTRASPRQRAIGSTIKNEILQNPRWPPTPK